MADMIKIEKVTYDGCSVASKPEYPWGTKLTLEDETLDKMDLGALQPGDVVEVRGYAIIESVSQRADSNESSKSMSMQMTEICITRQMPDRMDQLYGVKS